MYVSAPTREEGLRRLEQFLPHAGRSYAKLRNYDRGPGKHVDVSCLSPWIRHRLVLEEEVVAAVLARHRFSAAEKFVQEVFWRTYWKGWLELRPSVWTDYRRRVRGQIDDLDQHAGQRDRWEIATSGQTGIDCFDAWSQELTETGYLHNHARMWFASIWIFTLELPWELGADFFLRHLLDGDPASNTLSWRWVAGLQTRGKTYLARPDNIQKFTEGRFQPRGLLSSKANALDGAPSPAPIAPPQSIPWDRDLPTGLLLTEEDLYPESLFAEASAFRAALAVKVTERRSPLGIAQLVEAFVERAIDDALARQGKQADSVCRVADAGDLSSTVVEWARNKGLRQIVTPYAPVGPTAETLPRISDALLAHGISLIPVVRRWDQLAWPHATRGYFAFKEKIPTILRGMGNNGTRATKYDLAAARR